MIPVENESPPSRRSQLPGKRLLARSHRAARCFKRHGERRGDPAVPFARQLFRPHEGSRQSGSVSGRRPGARKAGAATSIFGVVSRVKRYPERDKETRGLRAKCAHG